MPRFTVRPASTDELRSLNFGNLLSRPGFQPDYCRVGVLDGQIISHALTERATMRYGSSPLRVMGIGSVHTRPSYRRRGYATAVLRDALAFMMEQGAHLALLHDTARYFNRFGFSPVWPEYHITFNVDQGARLQTPLDLYPPKKKHIPAIAALYERHWAGRVAFTRSPELWVWRLTQEPMRRTFVVVDRTQHISGYVSARDFTTDEVEVVTDTLEAAQTIISEISRLHLRVGKSFLRWLIPPDDAFVVFARELLDVAVSAHFQRKQGWQARLIDTPGLIATLLPEINAQAQSVDPHFDPASLVINSHPEGVEFALRGSPASAVKLPQRDFIQVVFGSLQPRLLGIRDGLPDEAVTLLETLFPPRIAALSTWDYF